MSAEHGAGTDPVGGRGTTAKGAHRRQLLVDAATELLAARGVDAVSHRAVAASAGLPVSATTYYFASLEELLVLAARQLAERWEAAARDVVAALPERLDGPDALVAALRDVATAGAPAEPDALVTFYERYLGAARHPGLRPVVARYDAQLDALLAEVLQRGGAPATPATARLVLAVVDGALLRTLAEGEPPASVLPVLRHAVAALTADAAR